MSILKVNQIQHANGTEAMTIDSSGNITAPGNIATPNKPAFFVRKTDGGAMGPSNPVVFNDVITNVGNYYNSSNGRFVAPVAGTYYFITSAHVETTNNASRRLQIHKNAVLAADSYLFNATGSRSRITTVGILTLDINDYITIVTTQDDFWAGDTSGIDFAGYLIG